MDKQGHSSGSDHEEPAGNWKDSDFGESNHKVAELIFLTNRDVQERGRGMLDPNQVILAHMGKLWIPPEGEGEPAQQGKAPKTLGG